jgi:S1-C subfamily serine protease
MTRHGTPTVPLVRWGLLGLALGLLALTGCPKIPAGKGGTTPAKQGELSDKVVERIKDAVVLIEVKGESIAGEQGATGSGFFISEEGELITNAHVVSRVFKLEDGSPLVADKVAVTVVLHPGTDQEESFPAEILRQHPEQDLAVLKVDTTPPATLQFADSDQATETSKCVACGHPHGLREISLRSGTVTAHRTLWERSFVEHDALTEGGNSGGPLVNMQGQVIGVDSNAIGDERSRLTMLAIPSNVVKDWLATDASTDPEPILPGDPDDPLKVLLTDAGLKFAEPTPGLYSLEYENGETMILHRFDDFYRVWSPVDGLPEGSLEQVSEWALKALRFIYDDPIGHLSFVENESGKGQFSWEAIAPVSVMTATHLKELADVGASQVERWNKYVADGQAPEDAPGLYPGGDKAAQLKQLRNIIDRAGLPYEEKYENTYSFETENGLRMHATIFRGTAYTYCHVGGMPSYDAGPQERLDVAVDLLKRNNDDPIGRLALDKDDDVIWECQVPVDFLTPDYYRLILSDCIGIVAKYKETYGDVPLRGGQSNNAAGEDS